MIPTRLEIRNFMSYKEAVIDFSEIEIASIVGANGAGKSTILQAITYALWGKVRTSSHNDVVRRGSDFCAVMLMFMADNTEYTVIRRRHLSGRGSSDLEFNISKTPSGKFIPLTAATLKDTQEKIDNVLGMSYDVFSSSALLQQGEASVFSDARPGERKELLAEMLNLGWFQDLEARARTRRREIEIEIASSETLLSDKQRQLETFGDLDDVSESIEGAQQTADDLEAEIENKREQLARDRQVLEQAKGMEAEIGAKMKLLGSYTDRKEEILKNIDTIAGRKGTVEKFLARKEEILTAKKQVDGARERITELADVSRKAFSLLEQSEGIDESEDELATLEGKHSVVAEKMATANHQIDTLEEQEKSATTAHNNAVDYANTCTAGSLQADSIVESLKKKLDLLKGEEGATCPTCGSILEDKEKIIADAEEELKSARQGRTAMQKTESEALAEARAREKELREIRAQSNAKVREYGKLETEHGILEADIRNAKAIIDKKKKAAQEHADLNFDGQEYAALLQVVAIKGEDADREHTMLTTAEAELETIEADLAEYSERLQNGVRLISDTEKEIDEMEALFSNFQTIPVMESNITQAEIAIIALNNDVREVDADIARLKGVEGKILDLREEIETLWTAIDVMRTKERICAVLIKACSKSGVQAVIIESALPALERDANELLAVMANNMKLALNSQRLTQSGGVSETLDIVVYYGGQTAPIETLSGGERFRADLALRLAIGRMLARRSSASVEMLAIDEGFGSQDADGQDAIVEVITSLQPLFDLILVISHVQSVAETIGTSGNMILVSKVGNESRLEVI